MSVDTWVVGGGDDDKAEASGGRDSTAAAADGADVAATEDDANDDFEADEDAMENGKEVARSEEEDADTLGIPVLTARIHACGGLSTALNV